MMDSIALAKAVEIQNQAREEQWRRDEDLFYLDNARDPSRLFQWLGLMFAAARSRNRTMKRADRLEISRSACKGDNCCGQAASPRR